MPRRWPLDGPAPKTGRAASKGHLRPLATADVCRAATIWGAAEAIKEKMGVVQAPDHSRRTDARIAEARTRIAPEAFDAAWAEGRELSLDEAVALAMM